MSGTFSFEALMVYFRGVLMMLPVVLYHAASLGVGGHKYVAQMAGVFKQDD